MSNYTKEKVIFESTSMINQYNNKINLLLLAGYKQVENNNLKCEQENYVSIQECHDNIISTYSDGAIIITGDETAHFLYKPGCTPDPRSNAYRHLTYHTVDVSSLDISKYQSLKNMFRDGIMSSIVGLDKWEIIHVQNLNDMFFNCTRLESINSVENWNVNNVQDFSFMFAHCDLLKTINLSKWIVDKVCTIIDGMFYSCDKLSSISLPTIYKCLSMSLTFSFCANIKEINLTSFIFLSDSIIDKSTVFANCKNLEKIVLPYLYEVLHKVKYLDQDKISWGVFKDLYKPDPNKLSFNVPDTETKRYLEQNLGKTFKYEIRNNNFILKPPCSN